MKTSHLIALGMIATAGIAYNVSVQAHEHGPRSDCRSERYTEHLSKLKTELKLTAAQEPAWQAYEKSVKDLMQNHPKHNTKAASGDRLQTHIAFMEQRLAGLKAIEKARTDLVQVLTPEQKKIFEQEHKPYRHHG